MLDRVWPGVGPLWNGKAALSHPTLRPELPRLVLRLARRPMHDDRGLREGPPGQRLLRRRALRRRLSGLHGRGRAPRDARRARGAARHRRAGRRLTAPAGFAARELPELLGSPCAVDRDARPDDDAGPDRPARVRLVGQRGLARLHLRHRHAVVRRAEPARVRAPFGDGGFALHLHAARVRRARQHARRRLPACGPTPSSASPGLTGFAVFGRALLGPLGDHVPNIVFSALCLGIGWYVSYIDIRISTLTLLALETASVSLIVMLIVIAFVHQGTIVDHAPAARSKARRCRRSVSAPCSRSSASSASRARRRSARRRTSRCATIPAAVIWSVIISGAFFVLCVYSQVLVTRGHVPRARQVDDAARHDRADLERPVAAHPDRHRRAVQLVLGRAGVTQRRRARALHDGPQRPASRAARAGRTTRHKSPYVALSSSRRQHRS